MPSDAELAERLAARTLELVDIGSVSRSESELAAHVRGVLSGVEVEDLGDDCLLARPPGSSPTVLLAGHLDTVPEQGNRPGSRDASFVHGLGASDMKAALAVMIEAVLDGLPYGALFFPREELPASESALGPLLERRRLPYEVALVMEPTDNELHAGCLGNLNAVWRFSGRAGHSARPWFASNAVHAMAIGIAKLASWPSVPVDFDGLVFHEVVNAVQVSGGIASNVVPASAECVVNFRYAPGRTPAEAESRLLELTGGLGSLEITGHAASGPVSVSHPVVSRLISVGSLHVAPKQAWTPVAELAAAGYPAVNFGPGQPPEAHQADEKVSIAALVRSYRVLEALAAA